MSDFVSDPLDAIRQQIRDALPLPFYCGVTGLTLQIDLLEELGAHPCFVHEWLYGKPLQPADRSTTSFRNHPSLVQHSDWAEAEWSRLEALGKIQFFPKADGPPAGLHVNPCALLLKPRKGVPEDAPEADKFKARLLMDLKLGGINVRLPH